MIPAGQAWDRRYTEQPWPADPDPYLVELAGDLPAGSGLDVGSGPGRNSLWLAARGWDMTLLDASQVALDQATERAGRLGVTVQTAHADALDWEPAAECYDLVIVANLHPGPGPLAAVLDRAARALRAGGHLYLVGHHLDNLGRHGPPDPDRLLTEDRARQALPAGLSVELLETRHRRADHARPGDAPDDRVVIAWSTRAPACWSFTLAAYLPEPPAVCKHMLQPVAGWRGGSDWGEGPRQGGARPLTSHNVQFHRSSLPSRSPPHACPSGWRTEGVISSPRCPRPDRVIDRLMVGGGSSSPRPRARNPLGEGVADWISPSS